MISEVAELTVEAVREAIGAIRGEGAAQCWFIGERPERLVEAAEVALGFALSLSYRLFVRELGAGSVGVLRGRRLRAASPPRLRRPRPCGTQALPACHTQMVSWILLSDVGDEDGPTKIVPLSVGQSVPYWPVAGHHDITTSRTISPTGCSQRRRSR